MHFFVVLLLILADPGAAHRGAPQIPAPVAPAAVPTLADAHRLFYSARYEAAAEATLVLSTSNTEGELAVQLATRELRASALLFQIRRGIGNARDKGKALEQCAGCGALMQAFQSETARGLELARARLKIVAADDEALFFLGKFNLNHVWLHLGTLGRKTGWDQYWEARKSLDMLLARNPAHIRARVARAWIDYIVDTRMPRGTRWLLGGGNKKRALSTVRDAVSADATFYDHTEAKFALWDLHVREKDFAEATRIARDLARDFPENLELAAFLDTHDPDRRR